VSPSEFTVTTTRMSPKPFAWSYSRLKNYETCPLRYNEIDVKKSCRESPNEQLAYGDQLHKSAAAWLTKGTTLPAGFDTVLQPWLDRLARGPGDLYVESKLAIKQDFSPCEYFERGVWLRTIADVIKVSGRVALVWDWKTGKILEDHVQLALVAACVFAHYPAVERIRSEFIWLKDDAKTTLELKRADLGTLWSSILPRVASLEAATVQDSFPPKPGYLCKKYCPVDSCRYHGT
jgi:PD-(D/E)XK nuclease superfamily